MRILHIISNLSLGGAQTLLLSLCKEFARKPGLEIKVISVDSGEFIDDFRQQGIEVFDLARKGLYNPLILTDLIREIKRLSPDIIHTHLSKADFYGRLSAKLTGARNIFTTYHGYSTSHVKGDIQNPGFLDKVDDLVIRFSDAKLIAVSETVSKFLINRDAKNERRTTVIYNGINITDFDKKVLSDEDRILLRARFNSGPDEKIILISGRIEPPKGQLFFLKSVLPLFKVFPKTRLVFIGEGSDVENLADVISQNQLHDRVFLPGFVKSTQQYYEMCDIVAVPSFWEGFGLSALEGMAKGKLVISSDCGGLQEVIEDGKTGVHFKNRDEDSLRGKLASILNDEFESSVISENAIKEIKQRFDVHATADRYLALYLGKQ